ERVLPAVLLSPTEGGGPIFFTPRQTIVSACLVAVFAVGVATSLRLTPVNHAFAGSAPTPGNGIYVLGGRLAGVTNPGQFSLVIGDSGDAPTLATLPGRSLAYFAGTDVNVKDRKST